MNRTSLLIGAGLVLLGALGLIIPIITTQQTTEVAHIGDLKLQATESKSYSIPTIASSGLVVVGLVVLGAGLLRRP